MIFYTRETTTAWVQVIHDVGHLCDESDVIPPYIDFHRKWYIEKTDPFIEKMDQYIEKMGCVVTR